MKRLVALGCLLVGACETALPENISFARPFGRQPVKGTLIETIPTSATLIHPGGECSTPCRVDYGERVDVTLAKTGYRPLNLTIPVGARNTVVELRPVGRSTPVEEESLPVL